MAYKQRKRKVKKNIPEGIAHIHATFNNTIVTISDKDGNGEYPLRQNHIARTFLVFHFKNQTKMMMMGWYKE
jgi:hypothetical protein